MIIRRETYAPARAILDLAHRILIIAKFLQNQMQTSKINISKLQTLDCSKTRKIILAETGLNQ